MDLETLSSPAVRELILESIIYDLLNELREIIAREEECISSFYEVANLGIDPLSIFPSIEQFEDYNTIMLVESIKEIAIINMTIPRPYQQHFLTERGENRLTRVNFVEKMTGVSLRYFRFSCVEVLHLINVLKIPENLVFNGYRTTAVEAFCVYLHKMSSKARYVDLCGIYDLLPSRLSQFFNGVSVFLIRNFGHKVKMFLQNYNSDRERLQVFSSAIRNRGCPLRNVAAFTDGTCLEVLKPGQGQRAWWCGHHSHHCCKFLVTSFPNGLMTAFGPWNGSSHDSTMARDIRLDHLIADNWTFPAQMGNNAVTFIEYMDAGFGIGQTTITPYRRSRNQTPAQREWNREMSRSRISVEWSIGRVKSLWRILENKDMLRPRQQPVAINFINAILLTNLKSILNGSLISDYFGVLPPSLEDYLS